MVSNHEDTEERILVIKLGALGDFVQALGPMAAIRRHHPDAHITLLTTKPFMSLGEKCGYFDRIWCDTRPDWKDLKAVSSFRKQLHESAFTRVYDLQNNDRTALYFRLFKRSKRPEWVGTAPGASHRNTSKTRTAGSGFEGHVETLALAGIKDVKIDDLGWVVSDEDRFNIKDPYVLLVPGAAPARPEKRWPAENYGALAKNIHSGGYQPVIIGTLTEKLLAEEILDICPEATDFTGRTSLFDIIELGRHAVATFGNDTGPLHLIAPTGCPCWVLFSRHSDPVRHAPLGDNVHTVQWDDLGPLPADELLSAATVKLIRRYAEGT